jgi:C1A family cysteine protease
MRKKLIGFLICMLLFVIVFATNTSSVEQGLATNDDGCPCMFGTIISDYTSNADNVYSTVLEDLPPTWDWRNVDGKDWTTPIRNQFQDICGSCWAFGALAGLESYIKIWANVSTLDVDLSEQYMLSCSPGDCNGWLWSQTLSWVKKNGAIPESCLPYEADDTIPCDNKCPEWKDLMVGIDGYHKVYSNVTAIRSALVHYGPLPCTMDVYEDFYPNYSGGVYQYTWGGYVFGHCIAIVGYDDTWGGEDEGYWICKNSWGTDWGEDGWFRIAYGECKIERGVFYYSGPNYPGEKPPIPSGPNKGVPGEEYTFTAVGIDPDGDTIRYYFDWGEGNISWSDFINSGEPVSMNYTWNKKGTYDVRVKIRDEHGLESLWSDPLSVTMPRRKTNNILPNFFERYSYVIQILRNIFGF